MNDLSPEFIERYQLMLEKDPKSKLFAPLAEAYRKMGLHAEAEKLCAKGVKLHPYFPSGHVVYAKVLLDKGETDEAIEHLQKATEISPENILAHKLLGQCLLEQKRPKDALKSFKMVLFLNPMDETVIKHVRKLESLTADEYDDEIFEMKPLKNFKLKNQEIEEAPKTMPQLQRSLERAISLIDAYVVRSDFDKALETLERAENELGQNPELTKRRRFLLNKNSDVAQRLEEPSQIKPIPQDLRRDKEKKVVKLKGMLQRVNDRRVE